MTTFETNNPAADPPRPMPVVAPRRTQRLRGLLQTPDTAFLLEAHDGLSGRIVEEAGFAGIWASGLAIAAHLGVRDNNELGWTQVVDAVEFIADATEIPILVDGDSGFGNFNNVRRLVRKLEQRGVAGVCIEDKLFPKANSFIDGDRQPLADIEEFSGKIRAARDAVADPDFCVIARVEAMIAGWGVDEALRRAEAYHAAGADGIFMHSARSDASEILAFTARWGDRAPIVIAPTTYATTPTDTFRDAGVSVVLWANHMIRASVRAMQQTARQIFDDECVTGLDDTIAELGELFRLQRADELKAAELRYLPKRDRTDLRRAG